MKRMKAEGASSQDDTECNPNDAPPPPPPTSDAITALAVSHSELLTVAAALERLPVGRFHALHLLRAVFAWCAFAACQELSAYVFDGMQAELSVSTLESGIFAAAFPAGCIAGGVLSAALGDAYGRRLLILWSAAAAAATGLLMSLASSFALVVLLRAAQAAAFTVSQTIFLVWYTEFLPTQGRGALTNAFGVGWPIGRGLVILAAAVCGSGGWRSLLLLSSALLALLALLTALGAHESPRHLTVRRDHKAAARVISAMYRINRTQLSEAKAAELSGESEAAPMEQPPASGARLKAPAVGLAGLGSRLRLLVRRWRSLFVFAVVLMSLLSFTTVLLDTWGPRVFGLLLNGSPELPLATLAFFNAGDLCGIVASIFVVDRIGRRGCFVIGFFIQALLLFALISMRSAPPALQTLTGMLTASTRCFAWEAAQLWSLEAFPTDVRATAFAAASTMMRLASVVSLTACSLVVDSIPPALALGGVAVLQVASGVFAVGFLPKETSGVSMVDSDDGRPA